MNNTEFPLVSVITATYKKFERLFETIQSVIIQDYPNIEYIITDDGSPNFPQAEIEAYIKINNGFKIKVFHAAENRGTVKNLNYALKRCSGKYIFPLSCGDVFWSNDVVRQLIERFITTNCKVLVASRVLYKNNYEPICFLPHYTERKKIEQYNNIEQYGAIVSGRYFDMASGSAMYYSKAVLEEFNFFDERYFLWEDGPFLSRYLLMYKLTFAYDIISIWYEFGGVSTSSNALLFKDNKLFIANEIDVCNNKSIKVGKNVKKRMEYIDMFFKCTNIFDRIKVYLFHPGQVLSTIIISIVRFCRTLCDKYYIKKIVK